MLKFQEYLTILKERLTADFDLSYNFTYEGREYPLYAHMNVQNSKYVLYRNARVYAYETNEHILLRQAAAHDFANLEEEWNSLKSSIRSLVKPHGEHMSSRVSLVLVTNGEITPVQEKVLKRYHCQKGFALGFKGWADLELFVVTLNNGRVITHRKNHKTAAFYDPSKMETAPLEE